MSSPARLVVCFMAVGALQPGCAGSSHGRQQTRDDAAAADSGSRSAEPGMPTLEDALAEYLFVKASDIPGAGMGLFAGRDIPAGVIIGGYSGRAITQDEADRLEANGEGDYLFIIPECAADTTHSHIDGDRAHPLSRMNYAPRVINGRLTHLQNVDFEVACEEPYGRAFTTQAIEAGDELYVDYGEGYDYSFMELPEVQEFFLRKTGIPKRADFSWEI